jgi:FlaG/FlaF family flagellin (archaellin)
VKLTGTKLAVALTAAVAVVAAIAIGSWLVLRGDDEKLATGTCDTASYQLEAESQDDGVEVSFEVRSAAPGETWDVEIEQNGTSVLSGERQTDEDAEIDVDVTVRDSTEGDEFTATATPAGGGAACTATLTR